MTRDSELQIGPVSQEEVETLATVTGRALNFPSSSMQEWMDRLGTDNLRAARQGGRLVGGLGIVWMGHWFGGQSVPASGITAVGMAPEQRGRGIAGALMRSALEESYERGVPLSSLYPATVSFYRRSGYERAGAKTLYEFPMHLIDARERGLEFRAVDQGDRAAIADVYERYARSSSGMLDRTEPLWWRVFRQSPKDREVHTYLVLREGQPEGYLIYSQATWGEPLRIREACALSNQAARAILTFVADHRSMIRTVIWPGAPVDPFLLLLAEPHEVKTAESFDWMLRIVDVAAALSRRGYPAGLAGELHLEVFDDLLQHNNGRFVLQIEDGRGDVKSGGRGDLRLDVRSLAALYSGHLSPFELRVAGKLDGPPQALALAAALFLGPRPWMYEIF